MSIPNSYRLRIKGGLDLAIAEQGHPDGLPLLLLHGYSDSHRSFEPLMAALPPWIRMIAVSQRGHGDSGRPKTGYRVADFAGDVPAVLDALGVKRAVLVGHSMSSLIAQRAALDHPGRVAGLVLIGAFRRMKGNREVEALWHDVVAPMADPVDPAFVQAFQESTLARPVPADFLRMVVAESRKVPARVWRDTLQGLLEEDFSAALPGLKVPTLMLWGDRDGFSGAAEQEALAQSIRGSRQVTFRGIGHAPHWEVPDQAAGAILPFLDALTLAGRPEAPPPG